MEGYTIIYVAFLTHVSSSIIVEVMIKINNREITYKISIFKRSIAQAE